MADPSADPSRVHVNLTLTVDYLLHIWHQRLKRYFEDVSADEHQLEDELF